MLNTGRDYNSIKEEVDKNHIPYNYLACNDGTILLDENDKLVHYYDLHMREYDYELLFNLLVKEGYHPHAILGRMYVEDKNISEIANKYYLTYNKRDGMVGLKPMPLLDALTTFVSKYPDFKLKTWEQFDKLLEYEVSPKNRFQLLNIFNDNSEMIKDMELLTNLYHTQMKIFMDKVAYIRRFGIDKTSMIVVNFFSNVLSFPKSFKDEFKFLVLSFLTFSIDNGTSFNATKVSLGFVLIIEPSVRIIASFTSVTE